MVDKQGKKQDGEGWVDGKSAYYLHLKKVFDKMPHKTSMKIEEIWKDLFKIIKVGRKHILREGMTTVIKVTVFKWKSHKPKYLNANIIFCYIKSFLMILKSRNNL